MLFYANINTLILYKRGDKLNPKVKGIIAILISAIGFSFMSVFFRLAGDLPVFQKSLARNLVAMFIPLFFIYKYISQCLADFQVNPYYNTINTWTYWCMLIFMPLIICLSDADSLMKLQSFLDDFIKHCFLT
ncbi:Integral membrane domain protein [Staphylococcus aureus]|uniref:Integral membrane domain protein n=1 Tax=Staphylococcus aureus TaxID=1280 RepID=A0A380EHB2_STAAU|nr:Integral membrane domain protein [Staphylococcus aureus]